MQSEIEALLGRIKFLEETAAFSLINVGMSLAAAEMEVEAGDDRTVKIGEPARFRATFTPPEGIEEFSYTWDFGDGAGVIHGTRTVATGEPRQRVTATVQHFYEDDLESPYIVSFDIQGYGDAGQVEGEDTFTVAVKDIRPIEVFMDNDNTVEEDAELEFYATFTRPEELTDFKYKWNFGDGTSVVEGELDDGETQLSATHIYENYRNREYQITLTITAESEAGEVEGVEYSYVYVYEAEGLVDGDWSAGDNATDATRALSIFAQGLGTFMIWALIFSPAWLAVGGVAYGLIRLNRRRRAGRAADRREPAATGGESGDGSAE